MDERLTRIKKKLMKPDWTENLHKDLSEMPEQDAQEIVESMNSKEIDAKVNMREMQEDYIADYLAFLYDTSKTAFWKHVIISLDLKKGILWSDNMMYVEKMRTENIPDEVFDAVMNFAINYNGKMEQDIEAIGCVIRSQAEKFNRGKDIDKYLSLVPKEKRGGGINRVNKMLVTDCGYTFE